MLLTRLRTTENAKYLPLRALGRCPQITYNNKQNKGKNIPECCYDPGTLPSLTEGVCRFEINLQGTHDKTTGAKTQDSQEKRIASEQ
jgi:hypothetical protein